VSDLLGNHLHKSARTHGNAFGPLRLSRHGVFRQQFDVNHATPQVWALLDHGAVVTVGPEGATQTFAPVIALGKFAFDFLHPLAYRCLGF
jgi:hypothetical protein